MPRDGGRSPSGYLCEEEEEELTQRSRIRRPVVVRDASETVWWTSSSGSKESPDKNADFAPLEIGPKGRIFGVFVEEVSSYVDLRSSFFRVWFD